MQKRNFWEFGNIALYHEEDSARGANVKHGADCNEIELSVMKEIL